MNVKEIIEGLMERAFSFHYHDGIIEWKIPTLPAETTPESIPTPLHAYLHRNIKANSQQLN